MSKPPNPAKPARPRPSPTAFAHQPRIGEEVRFGYPDGENVVLAPATVVFLWPGDVLDLDVQVPGGRRVRFERVPPHLGSEPLPGTWRP